MRDLRSYFASESACLTLGLCLCGAVTERVTTVAIEGPVELVAHQCADCGDRQLAQFKELHRQWEFLVANGLTIDRANAVMSRRINEMERLGQLIEY